MAFCTQCLSETCAKALNPAHACNCAEAPWISMLTLMQIGLCQHTQPSAILLVQKRNEDRVPALKVAVSRLRGQISIEKNSLPSALQSSSAGSPRVGPAVFIANPLSHTSLIRPRSHSLRTRNPPVQKNTPIVRDTGENDETRHTRKCSLNSGTGGVRN